MGGGREMYIYIFLSVSVSMCICLCLCACGYVRVMWISLFIYLARLYYCNF